MKLLRTPRQWDRRTTIVATLGPATCTPELVRRLIEAGADVFRLNFSHGTQETHAEAYALVREAERAVGRPVAVLQDLAGPKVRVGPLPGGSVALREGEPLILSADSAGDGGRRIATTHPGLVRDVRKGDRILLDDGALELLVEATGREGVRTRVVRGGILYAHKGLNVPGVPLRVPVMTEKDYDDLAFGIRLGVDYVAMSFVQRPEDLVPCRRAMARLGRQVPIVAKLEKAGAIVALEGILRTADAVMVARGDLGVELPAEQVPVLQKTIIARANDVGIPVITATQMLDSMVDHPRPTRAETSDVANAILDGTDAVMLSEETAVGKYPVEAVAMMDRIARVVESTNPAIFTARAGARRGTAASVARAAAGLADELNVRAIVVITRTGRTAELVSKQRARAPLVAFTEEEGTARRLTLWWGIRAYATTFLDNTDAMLTHVEGELLRRRLAAAGETIVLVGSAPVVARGRTNFVKVHRIRSANTAQRRRPAEARR
ncbi:MAG: pyruvate kinase [Armatimonadota bacterium]|nr:pyruvate kinase [Armatimonadota bacterium]MDR7450854.1 pyruvate kinase [Armatimonadota bacterium]MDR7465775.1 pyruvate kinase [Armatimonadota bacterium]MDR7493683.1 pyruvate kinase [Armatimonadota bacterium]MDR7499068.1 pyruvate kinase [Armatimonadota bacterium]